MGSSNDLARGRAVSPHRPRGSGPRPSEEALIPRRTDPVRAGDGPAAGEATRLAPPLHCPAGDLTIRNVSSVTAGKVSPGFKSNILFPFGMSVAPRAVLTPRALA